jgi:hypothetical protein
MLMALSLYVKVWSLRQELPKLKKIIQYSGPPNHPGVLSWKVINWLSQPSRGTKLEGNKLALPTI